MNHAACATSDSVVTVVAKQRLGHTALHYAIAWNNEAFVDFMLKQPGIELGLHNEVCVRVCVTARVCVCVNFDPWWLVLRGGFDDVHLLLCAAVRGNEQSVETPLHLAIFNGATSIVKKIVALDASQLTVKNKVGFGRISATIMMRMISMKVPVAATKRACLFVPPLPMCLYVPPPHTHTLSLHVCVCVCICVTPKKCRSLIACCVQCVAAVVSFVSFVLVVCRTAILRSREQLAAVTMTLLFICEKRLNR